MKKFFSTLSIALLLALSPAYAGNGIVTEKLGITKVAATSGNVANAAAAASIPAVAGRLNYITGFSVTSTGSTAAAAVVISVTGLTPSPMTFTYNTVAGATLGNPQFHYEFPQPMPASAVNTAIQVSCAALGAGNTNTVTNVFGYYE